jgi:hypothetical protein
MQDYKRFPEYEQEQVEQIITLLASLIDLFLVCVSLSGGS